MPACALGITGGCRCGIALFERSDWPFAAVLERCGALQRDSLCPEVDARCHAKAGALTSIAVASPPVTRSSGWHGTCFSETELSYKWVPSVADTGDVGDMRRSWSADATSQACAPAAAAACRSASSRIPPAPIRRRCGPARLRKRVIKARSGPAKAPTWSSVMAITSRGQSAQRCHQSAEPRGAPLC